METININVTKREKLGKGSSNESRRSGLIPVMYYNKKENIPLLVDSKELTSILKKHLWSNAVLSLTLPGKKKETMAVIKEVQKDPISRNIIHTDFCEVSPKEKLKVTVRLKFVGIPVGVKLNGGILNHPRDTVLVECPITLIPETIDVDISKLDIGHTLHVKDLVVPDGVIIVDKARLTIATVSLPKVAKSDQATEAVEEETAAAEPAGEAA
ncbi:MAG: 50S ribosomal protein L25 [Nitrospinae bacterium]|nr:50S ribosomal protein L25 [Nitrospinota bacterium]